MLGGCLKCCRSSRSVSALMCHPPSEVGLDWMASSLASMCIEQVCLAYAIGEFVV